MGLVVLVLGYIHNSDIVSIDVNSLITNYQLLVAVRVPQNVKIAITQIQLVLIFCQKLVLGWVVLVKSDDEEAQLLIEFVCDQVKLVSLLVMDYLFDGSDVEEVVKVCFSFTLLYAS